MKTGTADTATRFIGNCQLCEGDQKCHGDRLVHHGYRRPGDGYIHGDCDGVGQLPYELSCDLIRQQLGWAKNGLAKLQARLVELQSNRVTVLTDMVSQGWRMPLVEHTYVAGVTHPYVWRDVLRNAIHKVQNDIRYFEHDIRRFERRIAAWVLKPLRTVEEDIRREQALKAERKVKLDEKRAERQAKLAEKVARKQDLIDRRKQACNEIVKEIEAATAEEAAALVYKIRNQAKFSWLRYSYDPNYLNYMVAQCPRLVQLDLVVRGHNGSYYWK